MDTERGSLSTVRVPAIEGASPLHSKVLCMPRIHFIPSGCSIEELSDGGPRLIATTGECVNVVIHDAARQRQARKIADQFNPPSYHRRCSRA
jgi:hypothetical protein